MRQTISVRRENPADPKIPDVSTATGADSKSATSWEYFRLVKSSAAVGAYLGFEMVVSRLLAENESVQMGSHSNALSSLKRKDVTASGLLSLPRSRPTCSRIE